MDQYLIFILEQQRFAIPLKTVNRVIRAVEVKAFPDASDSFMGIINMHGQLVRVMNIRKRLNLCDKEIEADDQFIVCRTSDTNFVLPVDSVEGVVQPAQSDIIRDDDRARLNGLPRAIRSGGEVIMVYDPAEFVSNNEKVIS